MDAEYMCTHGSVFCTRLVLNFLPDFYLQNVKLYAKQYKNRHLNISVTWLCTVAALRNYLKFVYIKNKLAGGKTNAFNCNIIYSCSF